jgi:replicative DNA helicase
MKRPTSLALQRAEEFGMLLEKPLPHSSESERAILGAIILDNAVMAQTIELLREDDFYVRAHYHIFRAMVRMWSVGQEINPILVGQQLERDGDLAQVGGITFISELTYGLPHFTNIAAYAKVVRDKATLRNLINYANKVARLALDEEDEASVIVMACETEMLALANSEIRTTRKARKKEFVLAKDDKAQFLQSLRDRHEGKSAALPTGIGPLDAMLEGGGAQPQGLYLFAARPKVGKTSLILGIGDRVARRYPKIGVKKSVGIFSLEMRREALLMRNFSAYTGIPFSDLAQTGFRGTAYDVALKSVDPFFEDYPLYISDAVFSVDEFWRLGQRLVLGEAQAGLIILDYVQLAEIRRAYNSDPDKRYAEVTAVTREIKHMAQEWDVPIIAVSATNREGQKSGRGPELFDLKESGQLEYDAEFVAFLVNPDYKTGMTDEARRDLYSRPVWDINIVVAAQRNGPTGEIPMKFLRKYMQFLTVAEYEAHTRGPQSRQLPPYEVDETF